MRQTEILKKKLRHFKKKMFAGLLLLFIMNIIFAQERIVQGLITDESTAPIPGANIVIKGTTTGIVADIEGRFSLKVPSPASTLVITFMGYETQEIQVGEQTSIGVTLIEKTTELDKVVVIGYGVQKKSDLTGSVATVSSEQLLKTPSTGAVQALQGKAAGVQVINYSGMPGAGITVRIRGINTITKKDEWSGVQGPIYVIDGIPGGDINSINQNDIDHIEVLKDASAQAIYGSSGGNGVVLVTTKQGAKSQKAKVEVSMYRGVQSNEIPIEMCNTKEYIQIYNSLEANRLINITANPDTLPNTNWWNEMSHNAVMEEYNLSVTSGTENSTSLFSLGYLNQDGILKKTDYQRYNIRANTTFNISKRIKIGENINLTATRSRGGYDNASWNSSIMGLGQSPISYIRDTSSNLTPQQKSIRNITWEGWGQPMLNTGAGNPVAMIYYNNEQSGTYRMAGNLFANIEILKGLTYNNNFGFDVNFYENDNFKPYYFFTLTIQNARPQVSRQLDRNFTWNWQHVLDYKTTLFEKHNIDLMGGFEANEFLRKTLSGAADSLILNGATPEYQYINATLRKDGSEIFKPGGDYGHDTKYAYFGRVNYEFNNLFLAQFSYRYDGSTKFGPNYRFGSFPAFSTGFKFSELDVVRNNLPFLSFGKIRFGWGKTGNDGIPGSKFYSLVALTSKYGYPFGGKATPGALSLAPANSELHWETITTYNYGLDMNFFDNKLSLTADYFDKTTTGMLQDVSLPLIVGRYGFSGSDGKYTDHIGSLSNKGIELALGYKDNIGDLKYSFDLNFTKIVSNLYDLTDTLRLPSYDPKNIVRNGDVPGAFWGYKTNGLFRPNIAADGTNLDSLLDPGAPKKRYVATDQPYKLDSKGRKVFTQNFAQPGDVRFVDVNGDTVFNDKDKTVIGNPNPKFTFGFTINLEYKGFDLNCFFQGSYGNDIYNAAKGSWYGTSGNWVKDAVNAYRAPYYDNKGNLIDAGNTTSNQFRLYGTDNYQTSDWYIEDGSYVRLKSVQLGYTLPESFTKKYGIERLRFYVGGKNLITWTKYTGLDPEIGGNDPTQFGIDYGVYPQAKMYSVGLNLSF